MDKETDAQWFARMYATNPRLASYWDSNYIWDANVTLNNKIKRGIAIYNSFNPCDKEKITDLRKEHKK